MNLYSRLLKYQSAPRRSNLENFLSEALCDFLNRLDRDDRRVFLEGLLGLTCLENVPKHVRFETQVSIPSMFGIKYPDIVGFSEGVPVIVIENKVDAGFTRSSIESEEGKIVDMGQLEVYGTWLHNNVPNSPLILLTRGTQPPDDFLDTGKAYGYGTCNRLCVTWQGVFDQLKYHQEAPLTSDLRNFLQQERLAMENPSRQDFFVLELFLGSAFPKIRRMMKEIRRQLATDFESSCNWSLESQYQRDGFQFFPENSLIWAWGMLSLSVYGFIEWGFMFPNEEADDWKIKQQFSNLPRTPFLFMGTVINDADKYISLRTNPPKGWQGNMNAEYAKDKIGCFCHKKLDVLLEKPDFYTACYSWIIDRFSEADSLVKSLY